MLVRLPTPRASITLALTLVLTLALPVAAQERLLPAPTDVLELDASVTSDVAPDLAVITMAISREGVDVAPLTKDVNEAMAKAFADAKATPGIVASNGGYSTQPRYDSRGVSGPGARNGWTVRAEIILKSKDFNALGLLVGRLSQNLQIARSGFELSTDLRDHENAALLERGARAFTDKAAAATRAFGYSGFTIRQVTLGTAGGYASTQMTMMRAAPAAASSAPLPIESGQVSLTLTVRGSVQMRR